MLNYIITTIGILPENPRGQNLVKLLHSTFNSLRTLPGQWGDCDGVYKGTRDKTPLTSVEVGKLKESFKSSNAGIEVYYLEKM